MVLTKLKYANTVGAAFRSMSAGLRDFRRDRRHQRPVRITTILLKLQRFRDADGGVPYENPLSPLTLN